MKFHINQDSRSFEGRDKGHWHKLSNLVAKSMSGVVDEGSAFSSKELSTVMPLKRSEYPRKQSFGVSGARLNFENQFPGALSKGTSAVALSEDIVRRRITDEGRTLNLEEEEIPHTKR